MKYADIATAYTEYIVYEKMNRILCWVEIYEKNRSRNVTEESPQGERVVQRLCLLALNSDRPSGSRVLRNAPKVIKASLVMDSFAGLIEVCDFALGSFINVQ